MVKYSLPTKHFDFLFRVSLLKLMITILQSKQLFDLKQSFNISLVMNSIRRINSYVIILFSRIHYCVK